MSPFPYDYPADDDAFEGPSETAIALPRPVWRLLAGILFFLAGAQLLIMVELACLIALVLC